MPNDADAQAAKPQMVNGNAYYAPHWGITPAQVQELVQKLRNDPTWKRENSMYTLVNGWIKPWTKGKGVGYALLTNTDRPREVNCMISRAWSENAEDFFDVLQRSTFEDDVLFVCALSLYQPEDGAGPTICEQLGGEATESPFYQVLLNIKHSGERWSWRWWYRTLSVTPGGLMLLALMLLYFTAMAKGCMVGFWNCGALGCDEPGWWVYCEIWIWKPLAPSEKLILPCAITLAGISVLSWFAIQRLRLYRGRMIAVPNCEDDLYGRLWCVYEIFVSASMGIPVDLAYTLASAGTCSSRNAECSSSADKTNIQNQITQVHGDAGYDRLDSVIFWTMHSAHVAIAIKTMSAMLPVAVLCAANHAMSRRQFNDVSGISDFEGMRFSSPCMGLGILTGAAAEFIIGFHVMKRAQGKPSVRALCIMITAFLVLAGISYLLEKLFILAFDSDLTCGPCICVASTLYWTWRGMFHGVVYLLLFLLPGFCLPPGINRALAHRAWLVVILLCTSGIILHDAVLSVQDRTRGDSDVRQVLGVIAAFTVTRVAVWVGPFALLLYQVLKWGIAIPSLWSSGQEGFCAAGGLSYLQAHVPQTKQANCFGVKVASVPMP